MLSNRDAEIIGFRAVIGAIVRLSAGAEGLEPATAGFGNQCSAN